MPSGMKFADRNLMNVDPNKEQFEPTDAQPIRQHARMAGDPLAAGSSQGVISKNISELHGGQTYAHTAKKFGKAAADRQAIAIAMNKAGRSRGR